MFNFGLQNGWIVFKNGRIYTKGYLNATIEKVNGAYQIIYRDKTRKRSTIDFIDNVYSNDIAKKQLLSLNINSKFDYPKPINFISNLIQTHFSQSSTILDFFAGSGTTLHAVMKLNEEDGGNRQCILVQLDENGICENVTYERNRRVMQGYENPKGEQVPGLGNSLKYYRTAFVGKNPPARALDADRIELACKAGYLLAMGENTLFEQTRTETFQIFADSAKKKRVTAIYFEMDIEGLDEFERQVKEYARTAEKVSAYLFSWSNGEEFESMFEEMPNIEVKSIPQPILEIYRTIQK